MDFERNKAIKDIQTLPQTSGDSSTEGVDQCNYNLLQIDEKSLSVEGSNLHLACPKQEVDHHLACSKQVAVASTPMNCGVQISFPLGDFSREGVDECTYNMLQTDDKSISVEGTDLHLALPEQEVAVFSAPVDIVVQFTSNDGGSEALFEDMSASTPKQQQQSSKPPQNEDLSKLRSSLTESKDAITDTIVLKKLLRKSRYFDSGTSSLEDRAANFPARKRRKLCYLCGRLHHDAKKCPKRRACYNCKRKGHFAIDCPLNITESERICLKCGEIGHELSSCNNDYCPDDLEKIHCYVCNELGHIFCGSYTDNISMTTVSCYNCGESAHLGLQCPKPLVDRSGSKPPSICYKCGEEGHVARNCIISSQASMCPEGEQGAASHLVPEIHNADQEQSNKRARRSKSFRHGRARRRKLKGLVECTTV